MTFQLDLTFDLTVIISVSVSGHAELSVATDGCFLSNVGGVMGS